MNVTCIRLLPLFLLIVNLMGSLSAQNDPVRSALASVRERYAFDRRTAVFDVTCQQHEGFVVLRGEVDNPVAKDAALKAVSGVTTDRIVDSVLVLPDASFGARTFGIVTVSVGNVRSKPGEAEELGTQVLMGMAVKILKRHNGFYYVQSNDKYLGWFDTDALFTTDRDGMDAWATSKKVIVTDYFGIVRQQPDLHAPPVCDVVAGCLLKSRGLNGSWFNVALADGRTGFLDSSLAQDYDIWKAARRLNGENVEKVARMFVGIPYLWGGTSVKGMDCSGFTKTVYRLNGIELNRDADQQATMGDEVSSEDNFRNLLKGDLLFFGRKAAAGQRERITHVGIYLGQLKFIHCSGRVRLSSLDPAAPEYDSFNTNRLVRVRRVIPAAPIPEIPHER
jgi:cell wall-associated NlpC family hydrolase